MSADINLSKTQISSITQSGWLSMMEELHMLGDLGKATGKQAITDLAIPWAKDVLLGLVINIASNAASNAINIFERIISAKGAARAGTGFTLFNSNEDMDDNFKIFGSLKPSLVIDGVSKTIKYEIKSQDGRFLPAMMAPMLTSLMAPMAPSLIQPVASSLINSMTGKGAMRAEKRQ